MPRHNEADSCYLEHFRRADPTDCTRGVMSTVYGSCGGDGGIVTDGVR